MSGVIDSETGIQWEHCSVCHEFVQLEKLHYINAKYAQNDLGLDCCNKCFIAHVTKHINILKLGEML